MVKPHPDDEARHRPVEPTPGWVESWSATFHDHGGSLGGFVRLDLWPDGGEAAFSAGLIGPGRLPVVLTDDELHTGATTALEIRAPGLWTELTVLTPVEHFMVGLEAFGVALDDPTDAWGDGYGHRTPLGFDLEWESQGTTWSAVDGYGLGCRVHGEILVGHESVDFDGVGHRDHRWGPWQPETGSVAQLSDGWWAGPAPEPDSVTAWVGFSHGDVTWSYGLCTVRTQQDTDSGREVVGFFVTPDPLV